MRKLLYYEKIATEVCRIQPEQLWERTREERVVLARYFCILYRTDILRLNNEVATLRYELDRATAYHAMRNREAEKTYKGVRYKMYLEFMRRCEETDGSPEYIGEATSVDDVNLRIGELGWNGYIEECQQQFEQLIRSINTEASGVEVLRNISQCRNRIYELNYLFDL